MAFADHTLAFASADALVIKQGTQISIAIEATAKAIALVAAEALMVKSSMGVLRILSCSLFLSIS